MTALHQRLRRTILRHRLLPDGSTVLVGVSGGSDSVALTHLLLELGDHQAFRVAGLAHLNHRLRETAERDERFCRRLAEGLGLPLVVEAIDVSDYAVSQGLSIEDAARRVRYDFLERAAARHGADTIAVGHTRDDQAETLLLKLMRGAGLTGLGGIYPRRGRVVRPLLDASRDELRQYLESKGLTWVDDETNLDLANPRNRLRHVVIPELERTYGGEVKRSLARAAELVRDDAVWLDEVSEARYHELVLETAEGYEIERARLTAEPAPVIRRVLLRALRMLAGHREVGLDHVRAAGEVLAGACRGTDVPGGRVELRRERVVLSRQGPSRSDTLTGT